MKILLIFLIAFIAACSGNQLTDDLMDFASLIPPDETNEIVSRYMVMPEFQEALNYMLFGQEFKDIIVRLESISEYMKVLAYLNDSGVEIYEYLTLLYKVIGLGPFPTPSQLYHTNKKDVVVQCRDEIRLILPKDKIEALHKSKLESSSAFKYFGERIHSEEFHILLKNLKNNSIYKRSMDTLSNQGVNVSDGLSFYLELTGFKDIKHVSPLLMNIFKLVNRK